MADRSIQNVAQIREARRDGTRRLEVTVPRGTQVPELLKVHERLICDVIPDITCCPACLSGVSVHFREEPELIRDIEIANVVSL